MNVLSLCGVAVLWSLATTSPAQVVERGEQHFKISIEVSVKAPVSDLYQQFIQVGDWWQDSHTWFGDASNMTIDARAGGCFCEVNGEQQAVHMTVAQVRPNQSVSMLGGLGPLQSMAVNGHMNWSFQQLDEENSKLTLTYLVTGFSGEGLENWSKAVDGVLNQQVSNLKELFE